MSFIIVISADSVADRRGTSLSGLDHLDRPQQSLMSTIADEDVMADLDITADLTEKKISKCGFFREQLLLQLDGNSYFIVNASAIPRQ